MFYSVKSHRDQQHGFNRGKIVVHFVLAVLPKCGILTLIGDDIMSDNLCKVLVAGQWRQSQSAGSFQAENPATGELLPAVYPVSGREEALEVLRAGSEAASALAGASGESIAKFLETFATGIEQRAGELVELAHSETALAKAPRLKDVELPRTTGQLREAAAVARSGVWQRPVRDEGRKIYSIYAPLGGPVIVMGPNNFPFAFNSVAGGDFAAAIVARNPIIAKANTSHPGTTLMLAQIAFEALQGAGLPPATVQMVYRVSREVGLEMVSHPLTGATAFTGSKEAGLALKNAADRAGKPVYLEMSSINPVILLEGALRERGGAIADEFFTSCTMGAGQFCTNPGFVIVPEGDIGRQWIDAARKKFEGAQGGTLLGHGVCKSLVKSVARLREHGAEVLCGGEPVTGAAARFANTLLRATGEKFLKQPHELQTEAFGPVALIVTSRNAEETVSIIKSLEGNLTGTIYSDTKGADDSDYARIEPALRSCVGRLINDKMPTGVAVSPAMNHGGPFPATGHPGFTAVGLPASVSRFVALHCYDNVRPDRLPQGLRG
jgi:NADP-dependent aldehyde dehydrogenase